MPRVTSDTTMRPDWTRQAAAAGEQEEQARRRSSAATSAASAQAAIFGHGVRRSTTTVHRPAPEMRGVGRGAAVFEAADVSHGAGSVTLLERVFVSVHSKARANLISN